MSTSALTRLQRAIGELEESVAIDTMRPADAVRLKSEIESCIQKLDELRQKL